MPPAEAPRNRSGRARASPRAGRHKGAQFITTAFGPCIVSRVSSALLLPVRPSDTAERDTAERMGGERE